VGESLVCILPESCSCSFSLVRDASGSSSSTSRTTSDIIVNVPNDPINISVKHNNLSLKHQKADKLWCQMKMCETKKERFIKEYSGICDKWHQGNNATLWADVDDKRELYDAVNALTIKTLTTCPKKDAFSYLDFILDLSTRNKYIIKCNILKKEVEVLQVCVPTSVLPTDLRISGNFIEMQLGPDVQVRMRLHNCTTRVKKNLGLKYDTQIKGGLVRVIKL